MPTLKEIRADYPMYSDMSDGDFAKAFHAKFYNDLPFKDFSRKIGYLKGADPSEYDKESPEYRAKYGATSAMSGARKLSAGAGKGMTDLARGAGQFVGAVSRDDIKDSRALDADLMRTGAGRVGSIAGTFAGALPAALIPGANTYAGAALIGGGLGALQPSASTKETLTNTAAGAVLSPLTMLGVRGLVAGGKATKAALWDPFTKKGQERIAASTLQSMAGGQQAAQQAAANIRAGTSDLLPGVQPTTAELANNAGLANLERILKNNPEYTQAFAERAGANRNAMLSAIDDIAGDPVKRAAAEAARETVAGDVYQQATKAMYKVDGKLSDLLNRPAVQQAMKRAETLAENQGRPFKFSVESSRAMTGAGVPSETTRQITGQGLQDLKMAMDEMLTDPASGFSGKAGDVVKDLRGKLISWMEDANPAFKQARTNYAAASKPLNQMDIGEALRSKLTPALTDYGAQTRLRPEAFAQAMRNGDATAAQAMGKPYGTMDEIMTPDQMTTLRRVANQLARRTNADELGRAVGSNTGQNLAGQAAMRQLLGPMGMPQNMVEKAATSTVGQTVMGLPAKLTGKLADANILKKLVELGLTPEQAAVLLEQQAATGQGVLGYGGYLTPLVSGANSSRQ